MIRNSAREIKSTRRNKDVYNLTELGYNLRVIFMKSLYSGGQFSNDLYNNINSLLGDDIINYESSPSSINFELSESHSNITDIINSSYIKTLYQYKDEVMDILSENDIDISIGDIPVMTNITKYGNIFNIFL